MTMHATTDIAAYAWRKLDLLTEVDGKSVPLTVVLRTPFECEDERWLCAVILSALTHRKRDLYGATAALSLANAKSFALDELRRYRAQGGLLQTSDHQSISSLSSLFA